MSMNYHDSHFGFVVALVFILSIAVYIMAAVRSSRHYKSWPSYRIVFWTLGVFCAVASVHGPLANLAHMNFTSHMLVHLLLGMLAPLLMVLAAPMTLLLRTLRVTSARRLTRWLKSWPIRMVSDPLIASLLNIGGLWILYTTNLYAIMLQNFLLHMFIHIHLFLAGYLFTVSMIDVDPIPHKKSFLYRSILLVISLAVHDTLSKYIFAHPPQSVPIAQAEMGGMLMYYGGDFIHLILIFIFCYQWYRTTRPRALLAVESKYNLQNI